MHRLLAIAFLLAGCSSRPALTDDDLGRAEASLAALGRAPDNMVYPMTLAALGELSMGRSSRCLEAVGAVAQAPPDQRMMQFANAAEACERRCPPDLGPYATMAPSERMAKLVPTCDAVGADPLFGGDLAESRLAMPFGEYVFLRMQMEQLIAAGEARGGERAAAIVDGFRALAPRLSEALSAPRH